MRSKKTNRLLIIAPYQFGELSDCYYWAKYASSFGVEVTYVGYKYKNRRIKERSCPGIKTVRVPHLRNRSLLGILFYLTCIWEITLHHHFNVIVCRMPGCELLTKVFPSRNIILDVRTLSVSQNEDVRMRQNQHLTALKQQFKTCTVISEGVGETIGKPYVLLPLGAESLSDVEKDFASMKLFYIGTFNGRSLSVFIKGLARYQKESGNHCTFDIVGGGDIEEEKAIGDTIESSDVYGVTLHGYLNHDEAVHLFDCCNIGVCYVPVTEYYQYQPPTKLYEYLLSGMVCLATNTYSNAEVINDRNGIVIEDDEDSIVRGLFELEKRLSSFNSKDIVATSIPFKWEVIVKDYLLPLLR